MAIRYKAWVLALICGVLATPAMAKDEDAYEGAYLAFSAGRDLAKNACKSPWVVAGSSCTEQDYGYRFGYGYQFTPTWALEANYGDFAHASSTGNANFGAPVGVGTYAWQFKATGFAIQAVGTLHMGDFLAFFGKAGWARVDFNESMTILAPTSPTGVWQGIPTVGSSKNAAALGAGVELSFTPHTAMRFQAESFGTHDIYGVYGLTSTTTKVRLLSSSMSFVVKY